MADAETTSPAILNCEWGSIRVASDEGPAEYKDAKLWPGGSRGWDWNETGTHHSPGIQPADVEELVDNGADVVILSRGQNLRLQVQNQTVDWLQSRGVDVEILETLEAVDRYNELADDRKVGALIHSTC